MSDDRFVTWGFAHEQTPRTATFYYRERYKNRQKPKQARTVLADVNALVEYANTPTGHQATLVPAAVRTLLPTVNQIGDTENLIETYYELKQNAGPAPGPDGVTYSALSRVEVPRLMEEVAAVVRDGGYTVGPGRTVSIPKTTGGFRSLTLRSICDRVVAATLHNAMTPFWEAIFLPSSMGFRPGRGVWLLLTELQRIMPEEERWILASDDISKAFDMVGIDNVLDDHRYYIESDTLLRLIEAVLRGSVEKKRERGIDQGSAYSPTALNVLLHRHHDLGFGQDDPLWYRYADNLVYLCQTVAEGNRVLRKADQLLGQVNLSLKREEHPTRDLRKGEKLQLLGFTLFHKNDRLQFQLGDNAWKKLIQNLSKAQKSNTPALTATNVLRGWINGYGPAFESLRKSTVVRILQTASQYGFREIGSPNKVADWCLTAWENWIAYRDRHVHPL